MKIIKKLKSKVKKIRKKVKEALNFSYYTFYYYKPELKENWILIDSKNGKDLGSNLLRITEELVKNPEYKDYKVFLACGKKKQPEIEQILSTYKITGVELVRTNGRKHLKVLAMAKYLFTDTSFPLRFVKKEGQIITNTWHGTPLKFMGKDVGNRAFDMGNVQKNHLIADYLIYPSDYMKDIMTTAYFLNNLYKGKILCSGYPRNSVFFDKERASQLRKDLGLEDKRVYGYMPTWRGVLKKLNSKRVTNQLEYYFYNLDKILEDDEIFFVRLHPFLKDAIKYSKYKHIKPFPEGYDAYDVLNMCDCMVTDYSSIFFDYANSGNKIVLWVYDKEVYMDERGVYVSMDTFPFPQVRYVKELVEELRAPKQYDDTEFRAKYCTYDEADTTSKLCRHIIKGEKVYEEVSLPNNGKKNVLLYIGSLGKNGLTVAATNLLANVDREKYNYCVTFRSKSLAKFPERVAKIPEGIPFLPIAKMGGKTLGEILCIREYFRFNRQNSFIMKKVDRFYKRLYERNFGFCDFEAVIHYSGYEKDIINMFQQASTKRMIFVHNDMMEEIRTKGNQHAPSLSRAYHDFEKVAPVTIDIYDSTLTLGKNKDNLQVVNNCHDYKAVLAKGDMELEFQSATKSTVTVEELQDILDSDAKKFINIGRFSAEKGHDMLMKAFDKYYETNPNSYLIIIGGYGELYKKTLELAKSLKSSERIVIIKSIDNPMPILKKCDLFILSSLYEGLGLVTLEADTLGVPAICTDIVGPRGFVIEHGGTLVPPTEEGIYEGMLAFDRGEIKTMNVDFEEYNKNSVRMFESLFEGEV